MSYMDRLAGTTRTNAPVISAGSFSTRQDARRISAARSERDYVDSASYREMRGMMAQRHGMCG